MKKLLLFIAFVLGISAVNAQFGIQAGATFYSGKATIDNVSAKYDTKVGFTAGIVYMTPISDNFSFMPSLNYTQKGGKFNSGGDESKISLSYVDLPLNFVYTTSGFFIGAGPDLAFGVGGKEKDSFSGQSESNDIHFGSSADDDFKALEFSANILAGYKLDNGLFIAANYNPAISDIAPKDSGGKFHNNGFAIRIGYMFGGKIMKKPSSDTQ